MWKIPSFSQKLKKHPPAQHQKISPHCNHVQHLCTWELQYTNKKCILCNSKCLSTWMLSNNNFFFKLRNFERHFTSVYTVHIFLCLHVCNMCLHIQVNYCLCNLPARIHIYLNIYIYVTTQNIYLNIQFNV